MSKEIDPIVLYRPVFNDYGEQDWFDEGGNAARESLLSKLKQVLNEDGDPYIMKDVLDAWIEEQERDSE